MAARGENLGQVTATMAAFGVGAAAPLLIVGLLSREALLRSRNWLLGAGRAGKITLGGLLVLVGTSIVSGLDKEIEAALVRASPGWLTELTTSF